MKAIGRGLELAFYSITLLALGILGQILVNLVLILIFGVGEDTW